MVVRPARLRVPQLPVKAGLADQLLVTAPLNDLSIVHHEDLIDASQGRKPVGYEDRRPALHQTVERIQYHRLGAGVDRGRGLVEDQDRGIP